MSSGEMNRVIVRFARPRRLIATVLAVVLHCPLARAQAQNDHLIVPWQRIGPMSVGMSAADLIHSMGPPISRQPGEVVTYKWPGVWATVTSANLVGVNDRHGILLDAMNLHSSVRQTLPIWGSM